LVEGWKNKEFSPRTPINSVSASTRQSRCREQVDTNGHELISVCGRAVLPRGQIPLVMEG
jgi:hypothetical protein